MRDAIGNKLEKGQWVHWRIEPFLRETGIVCVVADVAEGTMRDERGRPLREPTITLHVTIPLDATKLRPGEEIQLPQIMRVVSPKSDAVVDSLLGGGSGTGKSVQ